MNRQDVMRPIQDAYRADIETLDAAKKTAIEEAVAEIEVLYKSMRQARFAEYVATRDRALAEYDDATRKARS